MELKGTVTKVLALQTGEGQNGTWKKQEFVINTDGTYPKRLKAESIMEDTIQT